MNINNNNTSVQIVDAVMGTGKSTWAINKINNELDKRYIVLTPLLTEVTRYKEAISSKYKGHRNDVIALDDEKNISKLLRLKRALRDGQTIITTHKLFTDHFDEECFDLICNGDYALILDETIKLVDEQYISEHDVNLLIKSGYIDSRPSDIVEDMHILRDIDGGEDYKGQFKGFVNAVQTQRAYRINKTTVIFVVPPDWIYAFTGGIYICTYLFEESETQAWLELFKLTFDHWKLLRHKGGYRLERHNLVYSGKEFQKYITIFDNPKMNEVGESKGRGKSPLSHGWYDYQSRFKMDKTKPYNVLRRNVLNYFKNRMKASQEDILWTCPKNHREYLSQRYFDPVRTETWLAYTARATNDFKGRHTLGFLLNVFPKPNIQKFFQRHGIKYDANRYALSVLLQWTWRSAIRVGERITIYLPSRRMRNLLNAWLRS